MKNNLKSKIIDRIDAKLEHVDECTAMIAENLIQIRANMSEVAFFKNYLANLNEEDN